MHLYNLFGTITIFHSKNRLRFRGSIKFHLNLSLTYFRAWSIIGYYAKAYSAAELPAIFPNTAPDINPEPPG